MTRKTVPLIALGFGLKYASSQVGLMGDASQLPSERLQYHGFALILVVAALASFGGALTGIFGRD
jgi:hypothetical protein